MPETESGMLIYIYIYIYIYEHARFSFWHMQDNILEGTDLLKKIK